MIEREALELLLEQGASQVEATKETAIPVAVIPESTSIVDLERFQEFPTRHRALLDFKRVEEFSDYVDAESGDLSLVVIEPEGSGARAIFDFGNGENPRWKDNQATLELIYTPEFRGLLALSQHGESQRGMIEFLEDWPECIALEDTDGEPLPLNKAITALRSVTVEQIRELTNEMQDFEVKRQGLEKIAAESKGNKLPALMRFTCPIREGLEPAQIECRISLRTGGGDEPSFNVRILARDAHLKAAAKEVEDRIRSGIESDKVRVLIGTLR